MNCTTVMRELLGYSWCRETIPPEHRGTFDKRFPHVHQGLSTALLLHQLFGGLVLKKASDYGLTFANMIDDSCVDFSNMTDIRVSRNETTAFTSFVPEQWFGTSEGIALEGRQCLDQMVRNILHAAAGFAFAMQQIHESETRKRKERERATQ
jgi:hypothetical protein